MLNYSFSMGIALSSLLICSVNLIYIFIQGRTDKSQNKIFMVIVGILAVNSLTGILSAIAASGFLEHDQGILLHKISRTIYFITHTALCPMFFYYVSNVSFVSNRFSNRKVQIVAIPFIITELLVITNPFTNFVWYIDKPGVFHRSWGEVLVYLAALFYFVLAAGVLISSWTVISEKRKTALLFFLILTVAGVIIQLIEKDMKVEVLAESVGVTGVMMSVENEDDRIDFGMDFYNRAALNLDISSAIRHNRHLSIIIIHIKNYDIINRIAGSGNSNVLSDILGNYLRTVVKRYYIYAPNFDTFALTVYTQDKDKVEEMASKIAANLEKPWDYKDYRIQMSASVMVAEVPGHIKSTKDLFYMIDNPVIESNNGEVVKGDALKGFMRRKAVEEAVSHGFAENSYEVYYQPTYHIDGRLHGAEALIRMHDRMLGNLYPNEFIPIAEETGLIDDIDDFVLDEVCKFLMTGIPRKYGIDNINVNLSVIQCMKPGFVESIDAIVEKYDIPKDDINFEITESIAADDYEMLSEVIRRLKNEGFLFSMDDYGTGYSNVSAVFSLNLDVVKIDKSLLWGAEKSKLGMIILENTIRMIQQMGKKILVEGVETAEQIELLKRLNVDYLQGFYFSKPIPLDDFMVLIREASETEQN
ncbi:MAG: EAL domain-containing protein [Eubacterium sp.]|nr:EAL domain-containing protein [Eubacterium sp.]